LLQEHLEKVLGNQPVEVSLDSKQVQVRPYAVSKGVALDPLMEACTDYSRSKGEDVKADERESNSSFPPLQSLDLPAGGGGPIDGAEAASAASTHLTRSKGDAARSSEPSEAGTPSLDFALCVGAWCSRDEDIFVNLLAKDDSELPYTSELPEQIWTCRVGEAASQAKHFLDDESSVHGLLATLASLSQADARPPPEPSVLGSVYGDDGSPSIRGDTGDIVRGELVASALDHLGDIEARAAGMQLAFFLDYDGTLTPIVDNPNAAVLSEEARSTVRALAARYPTAIVSGRARATAQGLVQLDELYYAGSHGFDITGPIRKRARAGSSETLNDGSNDDVPLPSLSYQVADSFRPALEEAKGLVEEGLRGIKGALVEDNTFSVSVHYRMVAEGEDRERVEEVVDQVLSGMPMLRRTEGKMVYELRPSAEWDKGKAVEWLLEQIKKEFDQDVFPFYIGDDVTDEDAFRIMGDLGGIGIIVSDTAVEDGTAASYALHNPLQVVHFLDHFANVVSESQCERDQRDQRDQRDHQRDHPFEFASA